MRKFTIHAAIEIAPMVTFEPTKLQVRVLGGCELQTRNGNVVTLKGAKVKALVAILALCAGTPVSRKKLADLLWSDRGEEQARASLRQALAELRRSLDDPSVLVTEGNSVGFDPALIVSDVAEFERLIEAQLPHDALDAYAGALLDGVEIGDRAFDRWLTLERGRLRDRYLRALADIVTDAWNGQDWDVALDAAQRLLEEDPLDQRSCRILMRILAHRAQWSQAQKVFDRLRRQQGANVEPETEETYRLIRDRKIPASPASAAAPAGPAIAILPFVDLNGDPGHAQPSGGLAAEITTALLPFPTLRVVSRTSSLRADSADPRVIGRDLDVQYLVQGTMRRTGDQVRINAQLIEARSGAHVWADNYDCEARSAASIPDDVIRAIATTLGYRIEAAERGRALRANPDAISAEELIPRSEALLLCLLKDSNADARALSTRAIALDPNNALAHTQIGWTHFMDYTANWVEDRAGALDNAFRFAQRATLLDDVNCRSRWLLGNIHLYRREYEAAREQIQTAMALNPNDVEARAIYSMYLICVGNPDAALQQLDAARQLYPLEFNWATWYRGIALFTAKRYEEATVALRRVHNPNNEVRCWLAVSLAAAGDLSEARSVLAEFLATAKREMPRYPGDRLADWAPFLHGFAPYRDQADLDHLCAALRSIGLD